jgi:sulfide:quinone oxidoreductase
MRDALRVTVLGGGPAAAELLLALRSLAGERVDLELITPRPLLPLRAESTVAAFGKTAVEVYDLAELAHETGASLRIDTAEAIAPRARRMRLASGGSATYDAVVVAVGARARSAIPGATVFRDQRDQRQVEKLIEDLTAGEVRDVAFAVPAGVAWTLPLYELALLTAAEVARSHLPVEVTLVTPERRALEIFGPATSTLVESLLADHGVRLLTATAATGVAHGRLRLMTGGSVAADRVIAVPRLVGRRLAGVPGDWNAFIPTDPFGRVADARGVFAAGDVTAYPVKQGGIATQHADVIAAVLAQRAGLDVKLSPVRYVLRSRLLGLERPLYLRTELDGQGRVLPSPAAPFSDDPPWWPAAKLFGRHLTPWMAGHHPVKTAPA